MRLNGDCTCFVVARGIAIEVLIVAIEHLLSSPVILSGAKDLRSAQREILHSSSESRSLKCSHIDHDKSKCYDHQHHGNGGTVSEVSILLNLYVNIQPNILSGVPRCTIGEGTDQVKRLQRLDGTQDKCNSECGTK